MQFAYTQVDADGLNWMPLLPLRLSRGLLAIESIALVDTGATINVMPRSVGLSLGAVWNPNDRLTYIGGSLGNIAYQPLLVTAQVGNYPPVRLVFAWVEIELPRLLLGHLNFLLAFNACFYRTDHYFEVTPI